MKAGEYVIGGKLHIEERHKGVSVAHQEVVSKTHAVWVSGAHIEALKGVAGVGKRCDSFDDEDRYRVCQEALLGSTGARGQGYFWDERRQPTGSATTLGGDESWEEHGCLRSDKGRSGWAW